MTEKNLEQAIEWVKSGETEKARDLLEKIIKEERNNISAWYWYAETWSKRSEKIRIWEACLRFNPSNLQAQQALAELSAESHKKMEANQPTATAIPPENKVVSTSTGTRSRLWLFWGSIVIFAALLVFAGLTIRNAAPLEPTEYKHTQPVEYYLYIPKDYTDDKAWPLFVGIHGSGGSGLDCWNLWQSYADKEGFILLCPSIPGDAYGFNQDIGEQTVWAAVGAVKKEYKVKSKMFMAGFSAGAFFIQGFHYHYPQATNGLAILSAGVYLDPRMFSTYAPIVVVIGDRDNASAVQTSKLFTDDLQSLGFDVQYQVMPGMGHTVNQKGINLTLDLFRDTQQ